MADLGRTAERALTLGQGLLWHLTVTGCMHAQPWVPSDSKRAQWPLGVLLFNVGLQPRRVPHRQRHRAPVQVPTVLGLQRMLRGVWVGGWVL